MSKIDALYEAAKRATFSVCEAQDHLHWHYYGREPEQVTPEDFMALVEVYRAARCHEQHDHSTAIDQHHCAPWGLGAAIATVEALG